MSTKVFTADQVAEHNTREDAWIIHGENVYDVTAYLDEHPGGEEVIIDCIGGDATEPFDDIGHSEDAHEILKSLLIGKLEGGVKPKTESSKTTNDEASKLPLILAVVIAIAAIVYFSNK